MGRSLAATQTERLQSLTLAGWSQFAYEDRPAVDGRCPPVSKPDLTGFWQAFAMSDDGTRLMVIGNARGGPPRTFLSVDGGLTWRVQRTNSSDYVYGLQVAATSIDGMKLLSLWSQTLFSSADGGTTWTLNQAYRRFYGDDFRAVPVAAAVSIDGQQLAVALTNGPIFASIDGGLTWTKEETIRQWIGLAASADGSRLLAAEGNGYLYLKTDSAWTALTNLEKKSWRSVACSANGRSLFALRDSRTLVRSLDGGSTWTETVVSAEGWTDRIASSSDATRLVAIHREYTDALPHIYTSADAGTTWSKQAGAGGRSWAFAAISADGLRLAACTRDEIIYISADGGATWQ